MTNSEIEELKEFANILDTLSRNNESSVILEREINDAKYIIAEKIKASMTPVEAPNDISSAIRILSNEFNKDSGGGSYRHSWIANIAMAMLDELNTWGDNRPKKQHDFVMVFNAGAERFIQQLTKQAEVKK